MKQVLILLTLISVMGASAQTSFKVTVSNPAKTTKTDEPVIVALNNYSEVASALVKTDTGEEIACQLDDLDQDGHFDELCFLTDIKGKEKKTFEVTLFNEGEPRQYKPRVYVEMLMRNDKVKEKNRHNNYIESITARGDCANSYNLQHHHGVSFESELNGIRIYFDNRQTLDLYGKFQKRLELKETQFYTSAEQKKAGYGDDVLWVGQTFGLGAFRGWNGKEPTMIDPVKSRTQRIISYGPLRTIVELVDKGWQLPTTNGQKPTAVDMTIRYTQYAGHRDTEVDVFFNRDVENYCFSTGIINVKGSEEFSDKKGLRACWGTDWPSTDTVKWNRETVGLAIMLDAKDIVSEVPAEKGTQGGNYAFVVKVTNKHLHYRLAYCSLNEKFGMKSAVEWFEWVKNWKKECLTPLRR